MFLGIGNDTLTLSKLSGPHAVNMGGGNANVLNINAFSSDSGPGSTEISVRYWEGGTINVTGLSN